MTIITNQLTLAKNQLVQDVVLYGYCNSILIQPPVDLSGLVNQRTFEATINSLLSSASLYASEYLNSIRPLIFNNLANLANFCDLYNSISVTCPPGTKTNQWVAVLGAIQQQANNYGTASSGTATALTNLGVTIAADAATFQSTVEQLNTFIAGNQSALQITLSQAGKTDAQVADCLTGTATGGLGLQGYVLAVATGSIAQFTIAGAPTPLAFGGVAILAGNGGLTGTQAAKLTLKDLYDQKASLLLQPVFTSEINLLAGISSAYNQFATQVQLALNAATQVRNSWGTLSGNIAQLISELQNGTTDVNAVNAFFTAGSATVNQMLSEINLLQAQLSGLQQSTAPNNYMLGSYILTLV